MKQAAASSFPSWSWFLFLWLIVFAVYSPALINDFVWDDHFLIEGNASVRGGAPAARLWTEPLSWEGKALPFWRPVPMTAYAVLFSATGDDPYVFHFFSIMVHAATATVLLLLLTRLHAGMKTAFCASALYAVHPYLTSAVTYASGLADPMAALLNLTALWVWLGSAEDFERRPESNRWQMTMAAGCVVWLAALLSKEWSILVPGLACLMLAGRCRLRFWAASGLTVLFVLGLYCFFRGEVFAGWQIVSGLEMGLSERLACAVASFGFYQLGGLLPLNLRMDRYYDLADPEFWRWFAAGCVMMAVWWWVLRRHGLLLVRSGAWRGLCWFLVFWLIHSNGPFVLNAHFAEHWMLFSYLGLVWAAVDCWRHLRPALTAARVKAAGIAVLLLGLFWGVRSFARQSDWETDLVFFKANLSAGAKTSRSHLSMASAYGRNGDFSAAIPHLRLVLEKQPGNQTAIWMLGQCHYAMGDYAEAAVLARQLVGLDPDQEKYGKFETDCLNALKGGTHPPASPDVTSAGSGTSR